jgi:hypothetical protein
VNQTKCYYRYEACTWLPFLELSPAFAGLFIWLTRKFSAAESSFSPLSALPESAVDIQCSMRHEVVALFPIVA